MPRMCSPKILALFGIVCFLGFTINFSLHPNTASEVGLQDSNVYSDVENSASKGDIHYAIVIDAGSSGSRLFVYVWPPHHGDPHQLLKISPLLDASNNPIVKKVNPGLSTFGEWPQNATSYIKPLLNFAAESIPRDKHKETTLFILATAGLRLIPEKQSTEILNRLRDELPKLYDFTILPKNIDMISGKWEGIYSWIAVNYALQRFEPPSADDPSHVKILDSSNNQTLFRKPSVGMIDMGGGSLQIAFEIRSPVPPEQEHLVAEFNLGADEHNAEHRYRLYVTTFLGFGANIAQTRYEDLLRDQHASVVTNANGLISSSTSLPARSDVQPAVSIRDPCVPAGFIRPVYHAANNSVVLFTAKGTGDFVSCRKTLKELLNKDKACTVAPCSMDGVHQPLLEFTEAEFYGFSEYYYSSRDVLGIVGIYDYERFVREASFCSTKWTIIVERFKKKLYPNADSDRIRTQCFKSAWISTAFHDGFGFPKSYDKFKIVSTIKNQEVQWTLGAVLYHMRFFALAEREKGNLKRQRFSQNSVTFASQFIPSGSGTLSQLLLFGCFVVVVLAALRYFLVLRKFRRRRSFFGGDFTGVSVGGVGRSLSNCGTERAGNVKGMMRSKSLWSSMMNYNGQDRYEFAGRSGTGSGLHPGTRTEWSNFVY